MRDLSASTLSSIALVTGAGGAIGTAIAHRLARGGLGTVLVDQDGARARQVADELKDSFDVFAMPIEADLVRPDTPERVLALIEEAVGRLDHLINNAGLNRPQSLDDVSVADWDEVLAVNLRAPILLSQKALPFWKRQGGGSIVNIGSRVWLSGSIPAYTASKAGLVGLTRSLAVALGGIGVRANVVAPSYIDTPFTRQDRSLEEIDRMQRQMRQITRLPRLGTAEDVANAVAFLVSDEASFITGEVLHVCGGAQLAAQIFDRNGV